MGRRKVEIRKGDRYGQLVILCEATPRDYGALRQRRVWVECDCGRQIVVFLNNLRTRNTNSCGCCIKNPDRMAGDASPQKTK